MLLQAYSLGATPYPARCVSCDHLYSTVYSTIAPVQTLSDGISHFYGRLRSFKGNDRYGSDGRCSTGEVNGVESRQRQAEVSEELQGSHRRHMLPTKL